MMLAEERSASRPPEARFETPRRRRRRSIRLDGMLGLGLLAVLILGCLLLYVDQRVQLMSLGYELQGIERRLIEERREQDFLRLQIAQAADPGLIAARAVEDLGMVRPTQRQFVVVEPTGEATAPNATVADAQTGGGEGLFHAAVEWVTRYWPRIQGSAR